ncbi:MAG: hypothetical protein ACOYJI_01050 [Anaerovoracaceae bacterium]|jgi:hypothetical protein
MNRRDISSTTHYTLNAEELNVTTKVGIVKNVSGPFVQVFLIPAAFTVVTELKRGENAYTLTSILTKSSTMD